MTATYFRLCLDGPGVTQDLMKKKAWCTWTATTFLDWLLQHLKDRSTSYPRVFVNVRVEKSGGEPIDAKVESYSQGCSDHKDFQRECRKGHVVVAWIRGVEGDANGLHLSRPNNIGSVPVDLDSQMRERLGLPPSAFDPARKRRLVGNDSLDEPQDPVRSSLKLPARSTLSSAYRSSMRRELVEIHKRNADETDLLGMPKASPGDPEPAHSSSSLSLAGVPSDATFATSKPSSTPSIATPDKSSTASAETKRNAGVETTLPQRSKKRRADPQPAERPSSPSSAESTPGTLETLPDGRLTNVSKDGTASIPLSRTSSIVSLATSLWSPSRIFPTILTVTGTNGRRPD
jgi:hypothetical protein